MDWNAFWTSILDWAKNTGIKIVIALVILLVSFRLITVITRKIEKKANDKKADKTIMKT